jgi:hypothetical protein
MEVEKTLQDRQIIVVAAAKQQLEILNSRDSEETDNKKMFKLRPIGHQDLPLLITNTWSRKGKDCASKNFNG